jgi:hypothetical protein
LVDDSKFNDTNTLTIIFDKAQSPFCLSAEIESTLKQTLKFDNRNRNIAIQFGLGFGTAGATPAKGSVTQLDGAQLILDFVTWKDVKLSGTLPAPKPPAEPKPTPIASFLVIPSGADFLVDTNPSTDADSSNRPLRSARVQDGMTLRIELDQESGKTKPLLSYDMVVDQEDGVQVDWKLRIVDQNRNTIAYVRVFPRWLSQGTQAVVERDVRIIPVDPNRNVGEIVTTLQSIKGGYLLDRQGSEVHPLAPETIPALQRSNNTMYGSAIRVDPLLEKRAAPFPSS